MTEPSSKARFRRYRSGWVAACFVGLMFATAITGPIPDVADWQSSVVCASGQTLSHHEYVTKTGGQTGANGTVSSPGTGVGFTYRCVGPTSVSSSRTAIVLALQFIAASLATFLLIHAIPAIIRVRRRLRRQP